MLHKTRNLTCLIFANGVSHFSKRYKISPNWHGSISNDPLGTENPSHSKGKFRVALSAEHLNGKRHPILWPDSGTHFPPRPSTGKPIPFQSQIPGHAFHLRSNGKPHPIPKANSGTHFPKPHPSGKPIPLWAHWGMELSVPHACHGCAHERCFGVKVVVDAADRHAACCSNRANNDASPTVFLDELEAQSPVKKKPREFRGIHVCIMGHSATRAAKGYSPSTAFLAAAAIWSRSSLVG